jgi:hypothetical protein
LPLSKVSAGLDVNMDSLEVSFLQKIIMKKTFPVLFVCLFLFFENSSQADLELIRSITTSKTFFNPTIGESCQLKIELASPGELDVVVIDRDGFPIRTIANHKQISAGQQNFDWDGKNNQGTIVPDEAYSLKIEFHSNEKSETYFPANGELGELKPELNYYDRQNAIFSYKLPKPARVHVQAGSAKVDPKTHETIGPVMKTLVNREPRNAGSVIEQWNGYDESNTIYIPNLPNFVTAIAATALPENSIITIGNRTQTFTASVAERKGEGLFTYSPESHHHHKGLSTLEDLSPPMSLKPINATWDEKAKAWKPKNQDLLIQGKIEGPSASYFVAQPGILWFYINGVVSGKIEHPKGIFQMNVPIKKLPPGIHIVSVNWGSKYGPTSANSIRIFIHENHVSSAKAN